jgi:hypothetical protein
MVKPPFSCYFSGNTARNLLAASPSYSQACVACVLGVVSLMQHVKYTISILSCQEVLQKKFAAIPHKERLATLHGIALTGTIFAIDV